MVWDSFFFSGGFVFAFCCADCFALLVLLLLLFVLPVMLFVLCTGLERLCGRASEKRPLSFEWSDAVRVLAQTRAGMVQEFYRLATEAAERKGMEVQQYLEEVKTQALAYKEVVDREGFVAAIKAAMSSKKFVVVLGGKSVGKTLLLDHTIVEEEKEDEDTRLTIIDIDVNMREAPHKPLFLAILDRIQTKRELHGLKDWLSSVGRKVVGERIAEVVDAAFFGLLSV